MFSEQAERFILHWGEMGTRWGINRAVAQIHALLLISDKPLHAQQISEDLSLARSNVSLGLKELQSWGLVSLVHVLGDRRDHFQTIKDIWEMFAVIAEKRLEREIKPTIELLTQLNLPSSVSSPDLRKRIADLLEFLENGMSFYSRLRKLPLPLVKRLLKLDQGLTKVLGKR